MVRHLLFQVDDLLDMVQKEWIHARDLLDRFRTVAVAQPLDVYKRQGTLALVHKGQIVNAKELRCKMEDEGSIFQGTSDSEIVLHLIQRQKGSLLEKIQKTAQMMEGAFAILVMSENSIYACLLYTSTEMAASLHQ